MDDDRPCLIEIYKWTDMIRIDGLREDTYKKVFFSGRTTKRGGGLTPLTTKQKNTFFP